MCLVPQISVNFETIPLRNFILI